MSDLRFKAMKRTTDQIYDELLVLRCQSGEADAIKELISRWQMRLARYVFRQTGDSDDTADVMQEIWVSVVRKLKSLDDPAAFGQWIYRIAAARTVDWIRKKKREYTLQKAAVEETALNDSKEAAESNHERKIELLKKGIVSLPHEQRTILTMFYLEERPVSVVAALLNIPAGTVKSRLFQARNQLRKLIDRSI